MKKIEDLRKMDLKKLAEELEKMQKELFKHKFEVRSGQSKNIHLIKTHRKQVATIKTIMHEKGQQDIPQEEEPTKK